MPTVAALSLESEGWLAEQTRPRHGRTSCRPQNREVKRGELGVLVIRLPLPPGTLLTLWNADERYVSSYLSQFPGYYMTADAGLWTRTAMCTSCRERTTSSMWRVTVCRQAAIEEVLASHPDVAECAVIGVHDEL